MMWVDSRGEEEGRDGEADQLSHGAACNRHVDFKAIADDGGGNHLVASASEIRGESHTKRQRAENGRMRTHLGLGDLLLHLLVALGLEEHSVVQLLLNLALGF